MFYAVASSFVLLLLVIYVPFLQEVFNTVPLTLSHWEVLLPLLVIPAVVAEASKLVINRFYSEKVT
jgi:Ca2+-transporting ATPase